MPADASYLMAMLVGLLGGVHCVGMCGGIVGMLSFGLPPEKRQSPVHAFPLILAYNLGRIASYTLAGVLVGFIGSLAGDLLALHQWQVMLQVIAGVVMILLGLYLAGWWHVLLRLEQAGAVVWKRIEPFGRKLLPVTSPARALLLGTVWGWLPCGLVYSVLIWALLSASPLNGGLLMLSFGIGTLPNLLAMGLFASYLQRFVRQAWVRQLAGMVVMGFGGVMIYRAMIV